MNPEMNILICQRAHGPARIRNATQRPCARCGVHCWASAASLATIASHGGSFAIVCIECAMPDAREQIREGSLQMVMPSEGQIDEIRRHGGGDVHAEELGALARRFILNGRIR